MRRLLPYLFLLLSTGLFGQTYHPFPDSAGVWTIKKSYDDGMTTSVISIYSYFLNGDTVIDSTVYTKLFRTTSFPSNIDTNNANYFGALREVNKKVMFYPDTTQQTGSLGDFCYLWESNLNWPSHNQEMLLYDFNVSVGDTIQYPHLGNSSYIFITGIDSILVQGQYRKRFNYGGGSCGGGSYYYVEGIGDPYEGLFSLWVHYFETWDELGCFKDDDVSYPSTSSCNTVGIDEKESPHSIEVYPNPSTGLLNISIGENLTYDVQIFDTMGKRVYNALISGSTSVNLSSLPKGIYMVQFNLDGELLSKLITLQ